MAVLILAVSLVAPGCDGRPPGASLAEVRSWAYLIQDQDVWMDELASSDYDLVVIDQMRSFEGEEGYDSRAEVAELHETAAARGFERLVLCYLDVGEAEDYRWYWQPGWRPGSPDWIVAPDPDGWEGNYPVRFWDAEWKRIQRRALQTIIEDGYDGVYLDWLEVYSFEPVAAEAKARGLDVAAELTRFIGELRDYALSLNPSFLFVAQNAAELAAEPGYLDLFEGVSQEAIWFDGAGDPDEGDIVGDVPVDPELTDEYLGYLALWQSAGKTVLNVEYATKPANIRKAVEWGTERGFKTCVTVRPLDRL
jgi:cysteinyl-tRNA synthetase